MLRIFIPRLSLRSVSLILTGPSVVYRGTFEIQQTVDRYCSSIKDLLGFHFCFLLFIVNCLVLTDPSTANGDLAKQR